MTAIPPIASQTSPVACHDLLSLSIKPGRLSKPEVGFQHHQKSQKSSIPYILVQKSLSHECWPTNNETYLRANAETRQLNYHVPSWETPSLVQLIDYFVKIFQFLVT